MKLAILGGKKNKKKKGQLYHPPLSLQKLCQCLQDHTEQSQ